MRFPSYANLSLMMCKQPGCLGERALFKSKGTATDWYPLYPVLHASALGSDASSCYIPI